MLKQKLNGNQLKLIAVIAMLIDHIGYIIGRGMFRHLSYGTPEYHDWLTIYYMLRSIGRIAFPIFCYMIVEGFIHSRNWKKYAFRLGVFALVSEIPFDYMVTGTWIHVESQNVYFTLVLGLLMLAAVRAVPQKVCYSLSGLVQLGVIVAFCGLATWLKTDYSYWGIMLIAIFYWFLHSRFWQCGIGYLWQVWMEGRWELKIGLAVSFVLLYFYNGERGKDWKWMKYFFYWFYPVHLLILGLLCERLFG